MVGELDGGEPVIKYTDDGGTFWFDATAPSTGKILRAVAWDKGGDFKTFWAVGDRGKVLETVDGGITWSLITNAVLTTNFTIYDVAFGSGTTRAIVVGKKGQKGKAYTYLPTTSTWTDVSPRNALDVTVISGVDAIGSAVFAVGTKVPGTGREGTVLELGLMPFELDEVANNPIVLECTVGKAAAETEPLNAVKMIGGSSNVFVGGQCGVIWELANSTWTLHRSETSAHIRHLSVAPNDTVYAAGYRTAGIHSCITRLK